MFNYKRIIDDETESFFTKNTKQQISKIVLNTNNINENNIFYVCQNNNEIYNPEINYMIKKIENKNLIQMIIENNINENDFQYYTHITVGFLKF